MAEREQVAELSAGRLAAEIVDLVGRLSSGTYELLVLVGELDARGSWAAAGALSCAAWLAAACDIDSSTARTQVRVARARGRVARPAARRRSPTRRQRRVLDERHHHCALDGCGATRFLQYDHKIAYALGGPTILVNLQRLCGPHNRQRARGSASSRRERSSEPRRVGDG